MAGPLLYFVAAAGAAGAKEAFKFASRKAAQAFAKRLGNNAKVTTKPPSGATIRPGPKTVQPRSPSTGRMQSNSPSPAPRKTTSPTAGRKKGTPPKPSSKAKPPAKSPSKGPSVTTTTPKKPARPGDNARTVGSSKSKPSGRDYSMKSRTNAGPPRLSGKPASLRASTLDSLPSVDTSSKKKGILTKRLDEKGKTPKSAPKPASKRPKARPAKSDGGAMTLRKYLNDAIAKRNSTVTEQKKGAEKYGSIAAAKKAGSLYYKNPKSGKIMAAVYKEDLKK